MDNQPDRHQGELPDERLQSLARLAAIVYGLQALSLVTTGLALFAGIIINYVRREDVRGTWLESHFRWQIRSFWFTLLWVALGLVTIPFIIGWLILTAASIWLIYRIVKGGVYLYEKRPLPR